MAVLGDPISVRLPASLRERITMLASATRRSQGDIVREVLERNLESLEWETRIAQRSAAHRSGVTEAIPAAQVDEELGLVGTPAADALEDIS
ncbi:ribbon-helix-helix protein, CopG family [Actinomyces sp. MRS3W]|uniref:type II toxin-antitoxin system RelB family antitoxin n=1 Tax=Actinomyces sp. MRS3W TaxID=2800796 RepID=UPI0028FDA7F8|nr:ribbon-helix-helix protein, CopG family [Actinomyces sp. MRS3W]MDU0348692.1 ribbon-helix-helix protein, CopG family [Actinomyces sp. MRS3W]